MAGFKLSLEDQLRALSDSYEQRSEDLKTLKERALSAHGDFKQEVRILGQQAKSERSFVKTLERGQKLAQKLETEIGANLAGDYHKLEDLDNKLADPRGGMTLSTGKPDSKFWNKYDKLLEQGKFGKAETLLAKGPGRWEGRSWFGGNSSAAWNKDIKAAQGNIKTYSRNAALRDKTEDVIASAEKGIAKGIRKILGDKDLAQVLRNMDVNDPAMTPELELMREYAIKGTPSVKKIMGDLHPFEGAFDMKGITTGLKVSEFNAAHDLHNTRQELQLSQNRQGATKKLASSLAVTGKMETQRSVSGRAVNMQKKLAKTLENFDPDDPKSVKAAESVIRRAGNKQAKWASATNLEGAVAFVENMDFNPDAMASLPGKSYAVKSLKSMGFGAKTAFAAAGAATVHGGQKLAKKAIANYQGFKQTAQDDGLKKAFREVATEKMHIPEAAVNKLSAATKGVGSWLKKGGHMLSQAIDDVQTALGAKNAQGMPLT